MVHTNWDNLWTRWSGSQKWWKVSNDRESLVKTAEELCKRTLGRQDDKKREEGPFTGKEGTQRKELVERRKSKMREREGLRMWYLARCNQIRIQILGDSDLIVNWMDGKWKINDQKFSMMVQKTQKMLDRTDIRPMGDHLDMFQHVYREWNREDHHLTHVVREKGATWNSYVKEEGTRIEAARSFFDGGVNIQGDDKIKNKVGSAYVTQIAQRIEENTEKMEWKNNFPGCKSTPERRNYHTSRMHSCS